MNSISQEQKEGVEEEEKPSQEAVDSVDMLGEENIIEFLDNLII